MKTIRTLLVDDNAMLRLSLALLLETYDSFQIVGQAGDGQQAIDLCRLLQPDVVLMDLLMPGVDGVRATDLIHRKHPDIQIFVLTSTTDHSLIRKALDAGAAGYLLKNVSGQEIMTAVHDAYGAAVSAGGSI
jgi:DNA-binding NarL/FixJ family response regulator